MIQVRKASQRGHFDHGWLDTYHSFSFADYYDPEQMGFRALRVLNEDRVGPGAGFPPHPHRDMEIITYILRGALEHRDNMGNGSVIQPGEVQKMSAGTGVIHSEMNPSATEAVHLLQIWITPSQEGMEPGYEQKEFPEELRRNRLCRLASPDGREGSIRVVQDVHLFASILGGGGQVVHRLESGRYAWLQVARGEVSLNGISLGEGDGAAASQEEDLTVRSTGGAEILLFDLA